MAQPRSSRPSLPSMPSLGGPRRPSLPQLILELKDLCIAYVRQEALVPLQQLGRYLGFGIAGSLLLGTGVMMLAVGALRALQTETGDTFTGNWSWVPYIIVFAGLMIGGILVWMARQGFRRKLRKELQS